MLESVVVKQLTTNEQFEQVLALEQEIWQQSYAPMHAALEKASSTTLVIGAYLKDQLIGFNYSERQDDDLLYSYVLGIKREYREVGVGELIKLKQKEVAEELGLTKCKWVFEPLEARMAQLNFTKLRGYSTSYFKDREVEIGTARVSPVDRLEVELDVADHDYLRWDAKIEEVAEEVTEIAPWSLNVVGLPVLGDFDMEITNSKDAYTLPIPTYITKVTIESPSLAEDWRYKTRAVFSALFEQGYAVMRLIPTNEHVSHYLFVKRSLFAL